jgi:hypothetical protein
VDVSLGALRNRLFALRSWDSTGDTLNDRIRSALNLALDRLSGEVPEALVPDEQHAVLRADVSSADTDVNAKAISYDSDKLLLEFIDITTGRALDYPTSTNTWRPTITGEWDGIMHLELTDPNGRVYRRQSREWFTNKVTEQIDGVAETYYRYVVSLDRPMPTIENSAGSAWSFRIHQPEFFLSDDVIEVLEPAAVYDSNRQQVWKIDTAGAHRQDMIDFQGNSKGRPYRCWRGRHFHLPAPTEAPRAFVITSEQGKALASYHKWGNTLPRGKFAIRYTYVWGRRDKEWQQSPAVGFGGAAVFGPDSKTYAILNWACSTSTYSASDVTTAVKKLSGINDPVWESAPSPVTIVDNRTAGSVTGAGALLVSSVNIDTMLGYGLGDTAVDGWTTPARYGRSGLRIRYYIAQLDSDSTSGERYNAKYVETNERFYLLCEADSTYDMHKEGDLLPDVAPSPFGTPEDGPDREPARFIWTGDEVYDYHRPLKHSTGYYAWKAFPHQDARYELDFRVLRLPRKYIDDQDTAPIQRDAIPVLIELALYYVSLDDGNDQTSAQAHLSRYQDLVRGFRERYANPGGIVEPTPITGYSSRNRYGNYASTALDD